MNEWIPISVLFFLLQLNKIYIAYTFLHFKELPCPEIMVRMQYYIFQEGPTAYGPLKILRLKNMYSENCIALIEDL